MGNQAAKTMLEYFKKRNENALLLHEPLQGEVSQGPGEI
jgi:hypothetical protein